MKKMICIGTFFLLLSTSVFAFSAGGIGTQAETAAKAKKYYLGEGVPQDSRKAKALSMKSCVVGDGCQLLTDIMVGRTAERVKSTPKMKKPPEIFYNAKEINGASASRAYMRSMSSLEYMLRHMEVPQGEKWRMYLKFYPLGSSPTVTSHTISSPFLVVADIFDGVNAKNIERYAFVYEYVPQADGLQFVYTASKNSFKTLDYLCVTYKVCRDLEEKVPGDWTSDVSISGNSHGYLEKAPWRKHFNIPAVLTRALVKQHPLDNKDTMEGNAAVLELTIDRDKDVYTAVIKEKQMDDSIAYSLTKAVYNVQGYDEAGIYKAVICGRQNSSKLPVNQCQ